MLILGMIFHFFIGLHLYMRHQYLNFYLQFDPTNFIYIDFLMAFVETWSPAGNHSSLDITGTSSSSCWHSVASCWAFSTVAAVERIILIRCDSQAGMPVLLATHGTGDGLWYHIGSWLQGGDPVNIGLPVLQGGNLISYCIFFKKKTGL